jgi:membrane-bound serine protease (ClpP class)
MIAMEALADVSDAWMILILLLAGAVLFLVEVLTPAFGLLAVLGVAALGGAVFFSFRVSAYLGGAVLGGCLVGTPFYLYGMVKLLPTTPLGRKLFLKRARDASHEATPDADELAALVGRTGVAESILRPSGVVRIDGKTYDARAEHRMIDKGRRIRVLRAGGTDVVVRDEETS